MSGKQIGQQRGKGAWKRTEVEIDHDIPRGLAVVDGAPEAEDLAGKHPPHAANSVPTLIVRGDGKVDELSGGIRIAQGNDGDVDVASLLDSLGVGARVRDDDQAGLLERPGDVVGERTGGEAAGDGLGAGVGRKLEHRTLAVRTGGDGADVGGIVDGDDDAGSQYDLLPEMPSMSALILFLQLRGVLFALAATYQVFPMLRTLTPSARVFQR